LAGAPAPPKATDKPKDEGSMLDMIER